MLALSTNSFVKYDKCEFNVENWLFNSLYYNIPFTFFLLFRKADQCWRNRSHKWVKAGAGHTECGKTSSELRVIWLCLSDHGNWILIEVVAVFQHRSGSRFFGNLVYLNTKKTHRRTQNKLWLVLNQISKSDIYVIYHMNMSTNVTATVIIIITTTTITTITTAAVATWIFSSCPNAGVTVMV